MKLANIKITKEDVYYKLALAGLLGLIVFYLLRSINYPPHDFSNYYFAGKFLVEGEFDESIYDPSTFNLTLAAKGYDDFFVNFSPNSPFIAIFFAPLSSLEIAPAKLLFNLINGFLFLFSLRRIIHYLAIKDKPSLLLIPLICFIPIRNGILFGQFYMLLFSFLIEGFLLYKKERTLPAMLLWAIPAALKMAPGIVVFYLIGKKDFKSVIVYVLLGGLLILSTGVLVNFDVFIFYLRHVSPKVALGEIVSAGFIPNQSPLMFFKYLFVPDQAENQQVLADSKLSFVLSMGITYSVTILLAFINSNNATNQKSFRTFAIWLLLIFLISPYGSSYSRILLIVVYLSAIQTGTLKKQVIIGLMLLFIVNFPYSSLKGWPLLFQFSGLFGIVVILALVLETKIIYKKHVVALATLCTLFSFYFYSIIEKRKDSGAYLMEHNPSLILDYEVEKNKILYTYWHGKELKGQFEFPVYDVAYNANIKEGQIYLNQEQLTSSFDHKKKPLLINGDAIIYLSDWGRGYGFYTLRIIQISK